MLRGEVWRVRMPFISGHLQAGDRPAVVVQNDAASAHLPTVLGIPFTSNQRTLRYPGTLLVQPDGRNGLTAPSVALVYQLQAFDQTDFLAHLGELDATALDALVALIIGLTA